MEKAKALSQERVSGPNPGSKDRPLFWKISSLQIEKLLGTSINLLLEAFAIFSSVRDNSGRIVDFRFEYINDAGCRLNQRTRDEQVGHTLLELLPAHGESGLLEEYVRVVEEGIPFINETVLYEDVYGSGKRLARAFEVKAVKLEDGFVSVWQDITERKRIQEALRESEERFRIALLHSPIAVSSQDRELRYTWIHNPHPTLDPNLIIGKTDQDLLSPQEAARLTSIKQTVLQSGAGMREEVHLDIDGQLHCFDLIVEPLRNNRGEIIGVTAVGIDISERKELEQKLRTHKDHLEELVADRTQNLKGLNVQLQREIDANGELQLQISLANERLEYLLSSSPAVIYSAKPYSDFEFTFISNNVRDLLGYEPEDFATNPAFWSEHIHPEDAQRVVAELSALFEHDRIRIEYRFRKKDGNYAWMYDEMKLIRDREGNSLEILGCLTDISSQKHAEEALLKSEQIYRALFEHASDAIFLLTLEEVHREVNQQAADMLGYGREELIGKRIQDIVVPREYPDAENKLIALLDGQSIPTYERTFRRKEGVEIQVEINLSLIRDFDGNPLFVQSIVRDITLRKQTEQALRVSEERYRALIDNTPDFIYSLDREGRHTAVNHSVCLALGMSEEELIGKDHFQLGFPKEVVLEWKRLHKRVLEGETIFSKTNTPMPDGSIRTYEVVLRPIHDQEKNMTGIRGVSRDITDLKIAEENLQQSEQRLSLHIQKTPLAVIEWDTEFRVINWNPSAERIFGYSQKETIGKHAYELIVPEEVQPLIDSVWLGLIEGKGGERSTNTNITKKGQLILCEWYNTPLITSSGEVIGIASLVQDITERVRAEEKLKLAKQGLESAVEKRTAELQAANKELEAFSYSVSHDLRAPLRAIDGFSRILHDEYSGKLDDQAERYIDIIHDNTKQMGMLIDSLLGLSRLGLHMLSTQTISIEPIVSQVLADLQSEQDGRNIEITLHKLPICEADPQLLKLVFANLISNALKFTRYREQALIEIGCSPPLSDYEGDNEAGFNNYTFFVKDNGAGFDMQYADKVFGVFQRLHKASDFDGIGVGLAIVQRIIQRHGGRVWAEAEPDKGATFYFSLRKGGEDDKRTG